VVSSFSGGRALAESGGTWGYLDRNGEWAVPPRWDAARPFVDGLARVFEGNTIDGYRSHYIDRDGELRWSSEPGLATLPGP